MALKDLFIKPNNEEQHKETPAPAVESKQPNIPTPTFTGTMPANIAQSLVNPSTGELQGAVGPNEEMVNQLWEAIKKRNFPGPDYLELKGHAISLAKRMPSYDQRLLAAFDILQGQFPDFNVEKVIKSIDAYKAVIEEERKEGEKQNKEILGRRVANAELEYNNMETKITNLQDEIKEKEQTLAGYLEERTTLQQNLDKAKADRTVQTEAFTASVEAVLRELESDRQTISNLTV